MPEFLSTSQATQLQRIARRYKKPVKLGKPWNQRTDDELWRKVLGQIAVVGRAEPGERLQHDPKIKRQVSINCLRRFQSDAELQKHLHALFVKLRVRYVGSDWKSDRKSAAAVRNFRKLTVRDTPKKFFDRVAKCRSEDEKIAMLQRELVFFGNKSARDSLIELRLAENVMALDARIYGVLRKVGVRLSPDDIYRQIEKELIQKVAAPLGMTGALLDRVFFRNYDQILKQR
jgi:hypothetical protein